MHELLAYWIREREEVRLRKEAGNPKPWSIDPILQNTYFCNVRREDDRVTRWLQANGWRDEFNPRLVSMLVLARMFNLPQHLACLEPDMPLEECKARTKKIRADGNQIFNGAYIITTCGKKMDKVDYVYETVSKTESMVFDFSSLRDCHSDLTRVDGLGSFLAAQVVADLKNTPGHPLQDAPDWWMWSAHGPGSLKGLSYLYDFKVTPTMYANRIWQSWEIVRELVHIKLHMQDFQNCLCEFSKYVRVKNGGRSKRRYNGS